MNTQNEPTHFGRRIIATIFDYIFFTVLVAAITFPLSASLGSNFRGGVGLFNLNRCGSGQMFTPNNQPISLAGWDGINVCDTTIDFVFPYRTGTIVKTTKQNINGAEGNFTQYLSYQLNDKNQIVYPFQLSIFAPFVLVLLAALSEYSSSLTPGKKIAGLLVESTTGEKVKISSSFIRNLLKYSPIVAWSVWSIAATPFAEKILRESVQPDGTVRMPTELEIATTGLASNLVLGISLSLALSLLLLVVPFSIIVPWRKVKRGIHDRLARTIVVRD